MSISSTYNKYIQNNAKYTGGSSGNYSDDLKSSFERSFRKLQEEEQDRYDREIEYLEKRQQEINQEQNEKAKKAANDAIYEWTLVPQEYRKATSPVDDHARMIERLESEKSRLEAENKSLNENLVDTNNVAYGTVFASPINYQNKSKIDINNTRLGEIGKELDELYQSRYDETKYGNEQNWQEEIYSDAYVKTRIGEIETKQAQKRSELSSVEKQLENGLVEDANGKLRLMSSDDRKRLESRRDELTGNLTDLGNELNYVRDHSETSAAISYGLVDKDGRADVGKLREAISSRGDLQAAKANLHQKQLEYYQDISSGKILPAGDTSGEFSDREKELNDAKAAYNAAVDNYIKNYDIVEQAQRGGLSPEEIMAHAAHQRQLAEQAKAYIGEGNTDVDFGDYHTFNANADKLEAYARSLAPIEQIRKEYNDAASLYETLDNQLRNAEYAPTQMTREEYDAYISGLETRRDYAKREMDKLGNELARRDGKMLEDFLVLDGDALTAFGKEHTGIDLSKQSNVKAAYQALVDEITGASRGKAQDIAFSPNSQAPSGGEQRALKKALVNAGWSDQDAENAVAYTVRAANEIQANMRDKKVKKMTEDAPFWMSVASVATNLMGGIGILETARMWFDKSTYTTMDLNSPYFAANRVTQTIRNTVQETYDVNATVFGKEVDLFDKLYGIVMSSADSIAAAYLGNAITSSTGLANVAEKIGGRALLGSAKLGEIAGEYIGGLAGGSVIGLNATVEKMADMTQKGANASQAFVAGIVAGTFESLFETVSISQFNFMSEIENVSNLKDVINNMIKSFIGNGSEEFATELANVIYDVYANYDFSDYKERYDGYRQNYLDFIADPMLNESEAEKLADQYAKKMASKDMANQVIEAGTTGAIQGVLMGAVGLLRSRVADNYRIGKVERVVNTDISKMNAGELYQHLRDSEAAYNSIKADTDSILAKGEKPMQRQMETVQNALEHWQKTAEAVSKQDYSRKLISNDGGDYYTLSQGDGFVNARYHGEMKNNQPNGIGLLWEEGQGRKKIFYYGEFKDGKLKNGVMFTGDGTYYKYGPDENGQYSYSAGMPLKMTETDSNGNQVLASITVGDTTVSMPMAYQNGLEIIRKASASKAKQETKTQKDEQKAAEPSRQNAEAATGGKAETEFRFQGGESEVKADPSLNIWNLYQRTKLSELTEQEARNAFVSAGGDGKVFDNYIALAKRNDEITAQKATKDYAKLSQDKKNAIIDEQNDIRRQMAELEKTARVVGQAKQGGGKPEANVDEEIPGTIEIPDDYYGDVNGLKSKQTANKGKEQINGAKEVQGNEAAGGSHAAEEAGGEPAVPGDAGVVSAADESREIRNADYNGTPGEVKAKDYLLTERGLAEEDFIPVPAEPDGVHDAAIEAQKSGYPVFIITDEAAEKIGIPGAEAFEYDGGVAVVYSNTDSNNVNTNRHEDKHIQFFTDNSIVGYFASKAKTIFNLSGKLKETHNLGQNETPVKTVKQFLERVAEHVGVTFEPGKFSYTKLDLRQQLDIINECLAMAFEYDDLAESIGNELFRDFDAIRKVYDNAAPISEVLARPENVDYRHSAQERVLEKIEVKSRKETKPAETQKQYDSFEEICMPDVDFGTPTSIFPNIPDPAAMTETVEEQKAENIAQNAADAIEEADDQRRVRNDLETVARNRARREKRTGKKQSFFKLLDRNSDNFNRANALRRNYFEERDPAERKRIYTEIRRLGYIFDPNDPMSNVRRGGIFLQDGNSFDKDYEEYMKRQAIATRDGTSQTFLDLARTLRHYKLEYLSNSITGKTKNPGMSEFSAMPVPYFYYDAQANQFALSDPIKYAKYKALKDAGKLTDEQKADMIEDMRAKTYADMRLYDAAHTLYDYFSFGKDGQSLYTQRRNELYQLAKICAQQEAVLALDNAIANNAPVIVYDPTGVKYNGKDIGSGLKEILIRRDGKTVNDTIELADVMVGQYYLMLNGKDFDATVVSEETYQLGEEVKRELGYTPEEEDDEEEIEYGPVQTKNGTHETRGISNPTEQAALAGVEALIGSEDGEIIVTPNGSLEWNDLYGEDAGFGFEGAGSGQGILLRFNGTDDYSALPFVTTDQISDAFRADMNKSGDLKKLFYGKSGILQKTATNRNTLHNLNLNAKARILVDLINSMKGEQLASLSFNRDPKLYVADFVMLSGKIAEETQKFFAEQAEKEYEDFKTANPDRAARLAALAVENYNKLREINRGLPELTADELLRAQKSYVDFNADFTQADFIPEDVFKASKALEESIDFERNEESDRTFIEALETNSLNAEVFTTLGAKNGEAALAAYQRREQAQEKVEETWDEFVDTHPEYFDETEDNPLVPRHGKPYVTLAQIYDLAYRGDKEAKAYVRALWDRMEAAKELNEQMGRRNILHFTDQERDILNGKVTVTVEEETQDDEGHWHGTGKATEADLASLLDRITKRLVGWDDKKGKHYKGYEEQAADLEEEISDWMNAISETNEQIETEKANLENASGIEEQRIRAELKQLNQNLNNQKIELEKSRLEYQNLERSIEQNKRYYEVLRRGIDRYVEPIIKVLNDTGLASSWLSNDRRGVADTFRAVMDQNKILYFYTPTNVSWQSGDTREKGKNSIHVTSNEFAHDLWASHPLYMYLGEQLFQSSETMEKIKAIAENIVKLMESRNPELTRESPEFFRDNDGNYYGKLKNGEPFRITEEYYNYATTDSEGNKFPFAQETKKTGGRRLEGRDTRENPVYQIYSDKIANPDGSDFSAYVDELLRYFLAKPETFVDDLNKLFNSTQGSLSQKDADKLRQNSIENALQAAAIANSEDAEDLLFWHDRYNAAFTIAALAWFDRNRSLIDGELEDQVNQRISQELRDDSVNDYSFALSLVPYMQPDTTLTIQDINKMRKYIREHWELLFGVGEDIWKDGEYATKTTHITNLLNRERNTGVYDAIDGLEDFEIVLGTPINSLFSEGFEIKAYTDKDGNPVRQIILDKNANRKDKVAAFLLSLSILEMFQNDEGGFNIPSDPIQSYNNPALYQKASNLNDPASKLVTLHSLLEMGLDNPKLDAKTKDYIRKAIATGNAYTALSELKTQLAKNYRDTGKNEFKKQYSNLNNALFGYSENGKFVPGLFDREGNDGNMIRVSSIFDTLDILSGNAKYSEIHERAVRLYEKKGFTIPRSPEAAKQLMILKTAQFLLSDSIANKVDPNGTTLNDVLEAIKGQTDDNLIPKDVFEKLMKGEPIADLRLWTVDRGEDFKRAQKKYNAQNPTTFVQQTYAEATDISNRGSPLYQFWSILNAGSKGLTGPGTAELRAIIDAKDVSTFEKLRNAIEAEKTDSERKIADAESQIAILESRIEDQKAFRKSSYEAELDQAYINKITRDIDDKQKQIDVLQKQIDSYTPLQNLLFSSKRFSNASVTGQSLKQLYDYLEEKYLSRESDAQAAAERETEIANRMSDPDRPLDYEIAKKPDENSPGAAYRQALLEYFANGAQGAAPNPRAEVLLNGNADRQFVEAMLLSLNFTDEDMRKINFYLKEGNYEALAQEFRSKIKGDTLDEQYEAYTNLYYATGKKSRYEAVGRRLNRTAQYIANVTKDEFTVDQLVEALKQYGYMESQKLKANTEAMSKRNQFRFAHNVMTAAKQWADLYAKENKNLYIAKRAYVWLAQNEDNLDRLNNVAKSEEDRKYYASVKKENETAWKELESFMASNKISYGDLEKVNLPASSEKKAEASDRFIRNPVLNNPVEFEEQPFNTATEQPTRPYDLLAEYRKADRAIMDEVQHIFSMTGNTGLTDLTDQYSTQRYKQLNYIDSTFRNFLESYRQSADYDADLYDYMLGLYEGNIFEQRSGILDIFRTTVWEENQDVLESISSVLREYAETGNGLVDVNNQIRRAAEQTGYYDELCDAVKKYDLYDVAQEYYQNVKDLSNVGGMDIYKTQEWTRLVAEYAYDTLKDLWGESTDDRLRFFSENPTFLSTHTQEERRAFYSYAFANSLLKPASAVAFSESAADAYKNADVRVSVNGITGPYAEVEAAIGDLCAKNTHASWKMVEQASGKDILTMLSGFLDEKLFNSLDPDCGARFNEFLSVIGSKHTNPYAEDITNAWNGFVQENKIGTNGLSADMKKEALRLINFYFGNEGANARKQYNSKRRFGRLTDRLDRSISRKSNDLQPRFDSAIQAWSQGAFEKLWFGKEEVQENSQTELEKKLARAASIQGFEERIKKNFGLRDTISGDQIAEIVMQHKIQFADDDNFKPYMIAAIRAEFARLREEVAYQSGQKTKKGANKDERKEARKARRRGKYASREQAMLAVNLYNIAVEMANASRSLCNVYDADPENSGYLNVAEDIRDWMERNINTDSTAGINEQIAQMMTRSNPDYETHRLAQKFNGYVRNNIPDAERMVHDLGLTHAYELIGLSEDEFVALRNALIDADKKEIDKAYDKIMKDGGKGIRKNTSNWIKFKKEANAWRFGAMLSNPTTWRNNLVSTGFNIANQYISNFGVWWAEQKAIKKGILDQSQATVGLVSHSKDKALFDVAEEEYDLSKDLIYSHGTKTSMIHDAMAKAGSWIAQWHPAFKVLESSDEWMGKAVFVRRFASVMKARGITAEQYDSLSDMEKAQIHTIAKDDTQKALYRNYSFLTRLLSGWNNTKAGRILLQPVLPFNIVGNLAQAAYENSVFGIIGWGVQKTLVSIANAADNGKKLDPDKFSGALHEAAIWTYDNIMRYVYEAAENAREKMEDNPRSVKTQLAKKASMAALGTIESMIGAACYMLGFITAGDDDDEDKARYAKANGYQKYSIKIGKKYFDLTSTFPASFSLLFGAKLAETFMQGYFSIGEAFKETFTDNTFISNLIQYVNRFGDALAAVRQDDYDDGKKVLAYANAWALTQLQNYATQFNPGISKTVENLFEGEQDMFFYDKSSGVPYALQYILSDYLESVPGIDAYRAKKSDMYGETIAAEGALDYLIRLAAGKHTTAKENDYDGWFTKLMETHYTDVDGNDHTYADRIVFKDVEKSKPVNGKRMTAEEYEAYNEALAQIRRNSLNVLTDNEYFQNATDEEKADVIAYINDMANKRAADAVRKMRGDVDKNEEFKGDEFIGEGTIDLHNLPMITDEEGNYMTTLSYTIEDGDKWVNIPGVITENGETKAVDEDDAIEHYLKTKAADGEGEHFGNFDTLLQATVAADALHLEQEKFYDPSQSELEKLLDLADTGGDFADYALLRIATMFTNSDKVEPDFDLLGDLMEDFEDFNPLVRNAIMKNSEFRNLYEAYTFDTAAHTDDGYEDKPIDLEDYYKLEQAAKNAKSQDTPEAYDALSDYILNYADSNTKKLYGLESVLKERGLTHEEYDDLPAEEKAKIDKTVEENGSNYLRLQEAAEVGKEKGFGLAEYDYIRDAVSDLFDGKATENDIERFDKAKKAAEEKGTDDVIDLILNQYDHTKLAQANAAGYSTKEYFEAYELHKALDNNDELKPTEKLKQFRQEMLSKYKDQKDATFFIDLMPFHSGYTVEDDNYEKFKAYGFDTASAVTVSDLLKGLKAINGYKGVRDCQRVIALNDAFNRGDFSSMGWSRSQWRKFLYDYMVEAHGGDTEKFKKKYPTFTDMLGYYKEEMKKTK